MSVKLHKAKSTKWEHDWKISITKSCKAVLSLSYVLVIIACFMNST